ncbi:uncharacterized protein [Oscarella lobularis]|uniref:uncharacterized protein isoform X2 n=1 Tax=Oscarella lobularis TaxID=121494 RepID=UPI003313562C
MLLPVTLSLALLLASTIEVSSAPQDYHPISQEIANIARDYLKDGPVDAETGATELAAKIYEIVRDNCDTDYVRLPGRPGPNGYIYNIAYQKVAVQSSVCCGDAIAARAVDGNRDTYFPHKSVAHTDIEDKPYWRVDLGGSCSVKKVVIYNLVDDSGERLQNFDVTLENYAFQPIQSYYYGLGKRDKFEFGGEELVGGVEHVRVQLRGRNYLCLVEVEVYGHCEAKRIGFDNVALNKYARQSSTTFPASNAVNGNSDPYNTASGSITAHTQSQYRPWWEVDVQDTAEIASVLVFNRLDCCRERLSNFNVTLYNFAHEAVETFHEARGGLTEYGFVVAPPKKVKFIRVQLLGTNYLTLVEVEAFGKQRGGYENIAAGKATSQSSTLVHYFLAVADKAVDGDVNGDFNAGKSSHTYNDAQAWWEVNLGADEIVYGVTIYNRIDCCGERLQNFDVSLIDTSGSVTKKTYFGAGVRVTYPVYIPNGVEARKVKVQLRGTNYLTLAEVQVWAGRRTCGGTANGARCAFPFTFKGVTYESCTTVGGNRLWCATRQGNVSTHNKWGFCFC